MFGTSISRRVCFSHLSLLTNRELILIQEGTDERGGIDNRYGGIYYYIPLNKIASVEINAHKDRVFTLSIKLVDDMHLGSIFSEDNRQEMELFLDEVKVLLSRS